MIKVAQTSNVIKDAIDKTAAYGVRALPDMYAAYGDASSAVSGFLIKHAINWSEVGKRVGRKALAGTALAAGAAPVLYLTGSAISRKANKDARKTVDYTADKTKRLALQGLGTAAAAYLGYQGLKSGYNAIQSRYPVRQPGPPQYVIAKQSSETLDQNGLDKVAFLVAAGRFYEDYCTLPGEEDRDAFESFMEKVSSTLQVRAMLEEAMRSERLPKDELVKAAAMHGINTMELFGTLKDYYEAMRDV